MNQIPLSLFNTNERFLLLQLIVKLSEKMLEAHPDLQPIYNRLLALLNDMEKSLNKSRGNNFTQSINELDDIQDNGFKCFRYHIEANEFNIIDTEARDKAQKLELIIRRHGWTLYRFGLMKQLAISSSLIAELKEAENLKLIDDLNLRTHFEAWSQAVDNIDAAYTQKVEQTAADHSIAASEIGKEAMQLIEQLIPGWYYQGEFGGQADYKELVIAIMHAADEIETQVRARNTRRENLKEIDLN